MMNEPEKLKVDEELCGQIIDYVHNQLNEKEVVYLITALYQQASSAFEWGSKYFLLMKYEE